MEDNTFKSLSALFKQVYNDKPIEAVKQPREKTRMFRRIKKKLENKEVKK